VSAAPTVDPSGQLAPAPPTVGAEAAHGLFERHAGAIYGYCLNRLGNREEAEDAVQTTFLNAFAALRRGVVPEYEVAWLYKIAENVCRGRHRSAGRRREVVRDPGTLEEVAPAAERSRDELFGLNDALGRLAPKQRRAIVLREWHGLSYREIARELRLTPAAVETLLFRARRSLARNLQVGSLIPWLRSLLEAPVAVKAAAAAGVVVASASLAGDGPVEPRSGQSARERAAVVQPDGAAARTARVGTAPVAQAPAGTSAEVRGRGEQPTGRRGATAAARRRPPSLRGGPTGFGPGTPGAGQNGSTTPIAALPPGTPPGSAPPALASPPPPPAAQPAPPPPAAPPPLIELPPLPELTPLPQLPGLPPLQPPPEQPAPQLPLPQLPPPPELPLPELPPLLP
jgi:RNA polymerase sigma-70 factor, ECF subfamily